MKLVLKSAAGATFPVLDLGRGEPVVFLHGALGDWRTFAPHARRLSDRARCLTYTQRWFGSVPWPEDGPAFGTSIHADDLIALVETLGIGPVSLVAWSYAGHAALVAVSRRPDLFRRALVYEPGVPSYIGDEETLAAFGQAAHAAFGPVFAAAQAGDMAEALRLLIDASAGVSGAFERQSEDRRRIECENAHTLPLLLAQDPPPLLGPSDLAALRSPVAIVWGERTPPHFALPAKAAARAIPGDRHRVIPGVGHLWPDDDPDGFVALVAEWLDAG